MPSLCFRFRRPIMRNLVTIAGLLVSFSTITGTADAGIVLTLSDLSSDETPPELLSATFDFIVADGALQLTVRNDTDAPDGFDIDAVFFNVSPGIDGLELATPIDGWQLVADERADGFGTFDYSLQTISGNDLAEIAPQQAVTFMLQIQGDQLFDETDFTTQFSGIPPGSHPAIAAAKFVNGPGDDSAFGAVVPEPTTIALLSFGAIAWLRRPR